MAFSHDFGTHFASGLGIRVASWVISSTNVHSRNDANVRSKTGGYCRRILDQHGVYDFEARVILSHVL